MVNRNTMLRKFLFKSPACLDGVGKKRELFRLFRDAATYLKSRTTTKEGEARDVCPGDFALLVGFAESDPIFRDDPFVALAVEPAENRQNDDYG